MTIVQQIEHDRTAAMKARAELKLSVLRMISTSLKNAAIAKMGELTDEETQKILKTEVKRRIEAQEAFAKAGNQAQVDKEAEEAKIIESYLPQQLGDEELEQIVKQALTDNNITAAAKFGQAMGVVMKAVGGRADGNRVQTIIKNILN